MSNNGQRIGQNDMATDRPQGLEAGASRDGTELSRTETAKYIVSMLEGLESLAKSAQLPFLAYLIDIAREEARAEKIRRKD